MASFAATSPARCPPMPSATANTASSGATTNASSLALRLEPVSVATPNSARKSKRGRIDGTSVSLHRPSLRKARFRASALSEVRTLGIETSTSQASVALLEGGRVVLARAHARPKQSAERLLPLIAELLEEAGWPRSSLDRIGVSVGPGSFTGLRVGIACAQGLSLGLGIPLVGVTSLQAMARAVPESILGLRCAILDARRAEVFAAV